ncbi:MAG: AI-2E family transporter [Parcubacteria group bacterium]|nr:AI-2E family transporter [Parcubacteria group bacterium]
MKSIDELAKFKIVQNALFFGLLSTATILFVWLIKDFIAPIFWAVVLTIVFYPIQKMWVSIFKQKSVAALLSILTVLVIVIVPIYITGYLVANESILFYEKASGAGQNSLVEEVAKVAVLLEPLGIDNDVVTAKLTEATAFVISWLSEQAVAIGQGTFGFMVKLLLMLYILFFTFRDGPSIAKKLMDVLPLGDRREKKMCERFSSITRAIFKGTLVIALVQGTIGGILFYVVGIKGALLWAIVMAMLSIIPAIGPAAIWLPAGIILLFSGNYVGGIAILAVGTLLISVVDNILRPILVGRDTQMPDAVVLLSTLGGLSLFGITGFIVGPIIAGFFLSMWTMFSEDYEDDLAIHG